MREAAETAVRQGCVRERPTVVLIASTGFTVRNYFLGGCLARLRETCRVVVLSPTAEQDGFRRAFEARGAEPFLLKAPEIDASWRRVRSWRHALHVAYVGTETWRLKRSPERFKSGRARLWNNVTFQAARAVSGPRVLRWADAAEDSRALRSPTADYYRSLYAELRPSVVFSPAPLMPEEWLPIQVARRAGIKTALAVLSWDNLSSKARMPLPCSSVLVWSEEMAREVLNFYPSIRPEQVHITGAPQFDFHLREELYDSREDFLRGLGGDPNRPLVVYAGVTLSLMPNEPKVVEDLAAAIRMGAVRRNPQLLVRLHPKDDGRRYGEFRTRYPEVLFTTPGERSGGDLRRWKPELEDVRLLVNTVRHGDVHVNVASTMTIDAAVLDRPVVNIAYDLRGPGERPAWGINGYDFTHYAPIMKTGGVRLARSPAELTAHLNDYLEEPCLDRDGRRRVVGLVCGKVDGRAGERVAEKLLDLVESPALD